MDKREIEVDLLDKPNSFLVQNVYEFLDMDLTDLEELEPSAAETLRKRMGYVMTNFFTGKVKDEIKIQLARIPGG